MAHTVALHTLTLSGLLALTAGCSGAGASAEDEADPGIAATTLAGWSFELQADGSLRCNEDAPRGEVAVPGQQLGRVEQGLQIPQNWGTSSGGASCPYPNPGRTICTVPDNKTHFWTWDLPDDDDPFRAAGDAITYADNNTGMNFVFEANPSSGNDITFTEVTPEFSTDLMARFCIDFRSVETNNGPYRICDRSLIVADYANIDDYISDSGLNAVRFLIYQHLFCHEIGHTLGYPHNDDLSTCMQTFAPNRVDEISAEYTFGERTRTSVFFDGDESTPAVVVETSGF